MMLRHQLCKRSLQFVHVGQSQLHSKLPRFLSSVAAAPVITKLFSNPQVQPDEIKSKMSSLGLSLTPDTLNSLLVDLNSSPDAAYKFFNWVVENENVKPNSKCFNSMLRVLSTHNRTEQFWGLVGTMRKEKGYGIDKGTFKSVSESFGKNGLEKDFENLKVVYENAESQICEILRSEEDEGEIFIKLNELAFRSFSQDLVLSVFEKMNRFPKKAYLLFCWLEQKNPSFEITSTIYYTIIRVLGREGCTDELLSVLNKMKDNGIELEIETYNKVMGKFLEKKMIGACVDLFQFNPSNKDFLLLLKKIVTSKDFELELVTKMVDTFLSLGNSIEGQSIFNSILNSLISVEKLGECDKVLKAMEKGGFKPDSLIHTKVVDGLCDANKLEEAIEYINEVHGSGYNLYIGPVLDKIIKKICKKDSKKAYKVLKEMVKNNDIKPMHSTYNLLIEKLIYEKNLKEGFNVLGLMKDNGFPPFIDPFVEYIAKKGSIEDALDFFKGMSVKEFPSRMVYFRIFEGLFKEKRYDVAQDLLSNSPGSVRNNADVLDLFYAMKNGEGEIITGSSL